MKDQEDKFLKIRVSPELFAQLLARAGEAGQRLGTYTRDVLQRDAQAISTAEALARIEAAISAAQPAASAPAASVMDHEARALLQEIRLIVRELAMNTNAQILQRVVAQLKTFIPPNA